MSELGNLSECMVDSDPEARARARRLRQKALIVSACIEAVCLGAMLLWPLITPGVLPSGYIVTPVPPYHGGGGARPRLRNPHPQIDRPTVLQTTGLTYHPNERQRETQQLDEGGPSDIGYTSDQGPGIGPGPIGPIVPGGNDSGPVVAPPRPIEPVRPPRQKVSEGVMASELVHRVEPVYPMIARNMHLSGVVHLRAIIATDGSVQRLELLSGSPILAQAAEAAVQQWRYRPTMLSGVPVEVETYITVNFILGGE